MKSLVIFLFTSFCFLSCQKESNAIVAFYLLGETQPFIADTSIVSYKKSNFQFVLTPDGGAKSAR